MDLSIKNHRDILPKAIVTLAGKCKVRECDEVGKGHFQAYVDEKKDSFDVSLIINKAGDITSHTCECALELDFCQHKTALLLHITTGKKTSLPTKTSKKQNPIEVLIADADSDQLRSWVKEILAKNKNLAISFTQYFSATNGAYTPNEVKKLTLDAVKSILKTKKKAENTEAKRVVDLWTEIHAPILDRISTNLSDEDNFLVFHAITEALEYTQQTIYTASTRIIKYQETFANRAANHITVMQDDDAWLRAVTNFTTRLMEDQYTVRIPYITCLVLLFNKVPPNRKIILCEQVMKQFATIAPERLHFGDKYADAALNMVIDTDTFKKYHTVFTPILFKNDYNERLLSCFIEEGFLELAEKYAQEQINANYKDEFSIIYLQLLKEIYTLQDNHKKLTGVVMKLFPQTFSFSDYQYIYSQLPTEAEKKNWRTKMLTKARTQGRNGEIFSFHLMNDEGNYKQMIEYIRSSTPYSVIALYAEKMMRWDKDAFFSYIFNKSDNNPLSNEPKLQENLALISKVLHQHFPEAVIQTRIRQNRLNWYYRSNLLTKYMEREQG